MRYKHKYRVFVEDRFHCGSEDLFLCKHCKRYSRFIERFTRDGKLSKQFHPFALDLAERLFSFGGTAIMLHKHEDFLDQRVLAENGNLIEYPKIISWRMSKQLCHANTLELISWRPNRWKPATGYGLSKDGIWYRHSWVIDNEGYIFETTTFRKLYFGIVYDNREEFINLVDPWLVYDDDESLAIAE